MDSWDAARPGRARSSAALGTRIARLRAERGWTQQQLADRIGISRVAVSHLETDINVPGERTVALLAGCFRLEPHELIEGTSYPPAKADRLPVVAARWTAVEHELALLDRDLWWIERLRARPSRAGGGPAVSSGHGLDGMAAETLETWRGRLEELRRASHDPIEHTEIDAARKRLEIGCTGATALRADADRRRP